MVTEKKDLKALFPQIHFSYSLRMGAFFNLLLSHNYPEIYP